MKRKSKKWVWLSVIALLLVGAGVAAWLLIPREPSETVYVYDLQTVGMTDYMDYSNQSYGMVTTDRVQPVYLTSTQTVTEVKVYEGQHVKKGAVLYTYDTTLSTLALQRKDLAIKQMELNLSGLQKELKTINGYKPISYSGGTSSTTRPTTTAPVQTSELDKVPSGINGSYLSRGVGDGTVSKPLYYWVTNNFDINGFIQQELVSHATAASPNNVYVVLQMSKSSAAGSDITQEMGIVLEKQTVEETPPETDPPTEPTEPSIPGVETEPTQPTTPATEPDPTEPEQHAEAAPGTKFTYRVASFFMPPEHNAPVTPAPVPPSGPNVNWNSGYTSTEIAAMKAEKQQEIKELQFEIKMAKAEYKIMQNEADDGKVVAQIDGIVKNLGDPETCFTNNEPLMKISGGGGYYVEGSVSELALDTIEIGQEVQVMSWMTGGSYTGTITEIGTYPVENGYYDNGTATSYYPYKVFVEEEADLTDGDYVEMSLSNNKTRSALYLEAPFVLTEDNLSYIFVQNEEGKLEKRQVVTGANLWGSYIEICSGLRADDLVAFPYGVKEGAPTEQGSWDTLYNY